MFFFLPLRFPNTVNMLALICISVWFTAMMRLTTKTLTLLLPQRLRCEVQVLALGLEMSPAH